MRYRLHTLLILLAILPPLFAAAWFAHRAYQSRQSDPWGGELSLIRGTGQMVEQDEPLRPPWHLVGLETDDAAVWTYLSQSSGEPERENTPGYGEFVSLYRDGVELSADTNGTITTVIIYGPLSEQYDRYAGPMPRSLTWEMTRGEVQKVIGKPTDNSFTRNSTTGRFEFYAEYPESGMYLNYGAKSESDMQARLIDIRIKNARM